MLTTRFAAVCLWHSLKSYASVAQNSELGAGHLPVRHVFPRYVASYCIMQDLALVRTRGCLVELVPQNLNCDALKPRRQTLKP